MKNNNKTNKNETREFIFKAAYFYVKYIYTSIFLFLFMFNLFQSGVEIHKFIKIEIKLFVAFSMSFYFFFLSIFVKYFLH